MMRCLSKICLIAVLAISLCSCAANYGDNPEKVGAIKGFKKVLVKGEDFWITTYQKISNPEQPFVFYIEGDGRPYVQKYIISRDPTPRRHVMFALATLDPRPNIIYVAKPCQYTEMQLNPKCDYAYWTHKRLSDDTVEAMNQVINKINNGSKFSLIGLSGGGGIAVLIAARNNNVKDIITIAGNLDHVLFTTSHKVGPMKGSLNPIDYAKQVNHIPQLHLSGGNDRIIPPFIADKYVKASESKCVTQRIFEKNSHVSGWDKIWNYIIRLPLTCGHSE